MSAVMLIASMVALGAYVCRLDALSWRRHPWASAVHVLGGIGAAWALTQAGQGAAGPDAFGALLLSVAWLVGSYPGYAPRVDVAAPPRRAAAPDR